MLAGLFRDRKRRTTSIRAKIYLIDEPGGCIIEAVIFSAPMLDSLFILLQNLPFGLLLAAVLLESFLVSKNRREVEPAVLWLLFCSICASALVVLVTLAMFFSNGDTARLHDGLWGLLTAAIGSLAWVFKRGSRNRGFLILRERFFSQDPREPARPKPGQYFWLLGWRILAGAAMVAALGGLLRVRPAGVTGKTETLAAAPAPPAAAVPPVTAATPPEAPATPAATEAAQPAPAEAATPAPAEPAAPPPAATAGTDPTKSELPPADASAEAEKMAAAAATPAPAAPAPAAPVPVVTPPPAELARPVSRNSTYATKIRPIMNKVCIKCHGADKQKGDLALHNPDAIRAGINGKPAIIPGDPAKSRVYACIILPPDDPDFMPQKGQPLSSSDKKALFDWIKAGADLGDGVSIPGGGGGSFVVDSIAEGVPEVPAALMESLTREHVIVRPLSKNKRIVEIDFSHSDRAYSDLKLAELAPIALNIYALDLSRTKVKDADLAHLAGMKNLSRLILSKTEITDAALAHLSGNVALEQINLYNTMVSDAGLAHLQPLKSLKKVYLWQSKATEAGAKQLTAAVPGVVVSLGSQ